ncbi:hypothetical protein [Sodalis sp. RH16]|uniref:hypothetical protein n=1 Tax=Sodalis sp. RH16 TaxID=3394331 RepID=UPI0039B54DAC
MCTEFNMVRMRQLSKFAMTHSAAGEFIVLQVSYIDSLTGTKWLTLKEFPDQMVTIKLVEAKRLLSALKKSIDYIEAGIEHPADEFLD